MGLRWKRGTCIGTEFRGEILQATTMRDDVANILDCMDVKACEKGSEGGGEDPKATKDSRGGIEECACRSEDYNMCFEGSSMKMGGGGEQRVGWEGRKGRMRRKGGCIIDVPACGQEVMDEGKVLLAFCCESVDIEGLNSVADLDNAEGVMALKASKARRRQKVIRVEWELLVCCVGQAVDDEHVGAEEGTVGIGDFREDPLGNAGGVGTRWEGRRAADV